LGVWAGVPVAKSNGPRVRSNGMLNRSLAAGATVAWWWPVTATNPTPTAEASPIAERDPARNRALPIVIQCLMKKPTARSGDGARLHRCGIAGRVQPTSEGSCGCSQLLTIAPKVR
jgi:hypothetical protein